MNKFIDKHLRDIFDYLNESSKIDLIFIKYINESLMIFKILLKTEILGDKKLKNYYDLLVEIIVKLEKNSNNK